MAGTWIDLSWLPLGAGGWFVRWNGRVYEGIVARRQRRPALDLYHSALTVSDGHVVYAVEMGPVWNVRADDRGVLLEGPVGSRRLGRLRAFRYEVRCWAGGHIPDADEAVGGPRRVTAEPACVAALLASLGQVPALTWGRDELGVGEMWNSNSVVSWALACAGVDVGSISPPAGGRAPGWAAGLALARRVAIDHRAGDQGP